MTFTFFILKEIHNVDSRLLFNTTTLNKYDYIAHATFRFIRLSAYFC